MTLGFEILKVPQTNIAVTIALHFIASALK